MNVLAPSATSTPGWHDRATSEDAHREMIDFVAKATPLGRLAKRSEIANTALFLASGESSFVRGIEPVDGRAARV